LHNCIYTHNVKCRFLLNIFQFNWIYHLFLCLYTTVWFWEWIVNSCNDVQMLKNNLIRPSCF
jgi:hypothetical protein